MNFLLAYALGNAFVEVLQKSEATEPSNDNGSLKITKNEISCGINHCPGNSSSQSEPSPTKESTYILFGILNGMILLSIVVTFLFVENLNDEKKSDQKLKFNDASKLKVYLRKY